MTNRCRRCSTVRMALGNLFLNSTNVSAAKIHGSSVVNWSAVYSLGSRRFFNRWPLTTLTCQQQIGRRPCVHPSKSQQSRFRCRMSPTLQTGQKNIYMCISTRRYLIGELGFWSSSVIMISYWHHQRSTTLSFSYIDHPFLKCLPSNTMSTEYFTHTVLT